MSNPTTRLRTQTIIYMLMFVHHNNGTIQLVLDSSKPLGKQLPVIKGKGKSCSTITEEVGVWLRNKSLSPHVVGPLLCDQSDLRGFSSSGSRKAYVAYEVTSVGARFLLGKDLRLVDAEAFALEQVADGQGLQDALFRYITNIQQRYTPKALAA